MTVVRITSSSTASTITPAAIYNKAIKLDNSSNYQPEIDNCAVAVGTDVGLVKDVGVVEDVGIGKLAVVSDVINKIPLCTMNNETNQRTVHMVHCYHYYY